MSKQNTGVESNKSGLSTTEIDYNQLAKQVSDAEVAANTSDEGIDPDALAERLSGVIENPDAYNDLAKESERAFNRLDNLADSEEEIITGFDYDYGYSGARPNMGQDLHELQAQRQSNLTKVGSGIGRALGEFAINVLEIPGVVGGAIAAGASWDVNKMTDNFWIKMTESMKGSLHDALPVYQRRAVKEGNVFDKMLSPDWWATDGASGIAFMGSALAPGLVFSKLPKALSLTRALGAGGKHSRRVLGILDDIATKTGAVSDDVLLASKPGTAAKQGFDLFNNTMANTLFEAGVEARGAQMAYQEDIMSKLESGEISYEQYEVLKAQSNEAASSVFGANMALLVGPNMVMSKMLLGPRGSSLRKATQEIDKFKGKFARKAAKEYVPYAGRGSKYINPVKKALGSDTAGNVGGALKTLGKNTAREGLLEEGGQGAIEQYFTKGLVEEKIHGGRAKSFAQTYLDFIGTADGQAAVLLGGLLGSTASAFTYKKDKKAFNKQVDDIITNFNVGTDYRDAITGNLYMRDPDDPTKFKLDENNQLQIDPDKVARMAETKAEIEGANLRIEQLKSEGDYVGAAALTARMQANYMYSFLAAGEAGIEALQEVILADPATDIAVEAYNSENGTNLTKEQYVETEINKAKKLKENHFYHARVLTSNLSKKDIKRLKINSDDVSLVEAWRDLFNNDERVNYTTQMHMLDHFNEEIAEATKEMQTVGSDNKKAFRQAKKRKMRATRNAAKVQENLKEVTDEAAIRKRWDSYYKDRMLSKKVNSKEVTDYLDTVIADIKSANSEDEVSEIVKKAKEDGLIVKGVKEENLPDAIKAMASSDNILESLGAFLTIQASETSSHDALLTEARRNTERLYKGAEILRGSIEEAIVNIQTKEQENGAKRAELQEKFEKVIADINALTVQLRFEEQLDRRKVTKKARDNYRAAVKAKNEATKLLRELRDEIESIDSQTQAANTKIGSYLHALRMIRESITNKEIGARMDSYLASFTEENVFLGGNSLKVMPFKLEQIVTALYKNKELFDMAEDIGELTIHSSELTYLEGYKKYYEGSKLELEILLRNIEATIKRNARLTKTPENEELLLESERERIALEEKLEEIDAKLFEIERTLEHDLLYQGRAADSYSTKINAIIEAIEELDPGALSTPDTFETPEEFDQPPIGDYAEDTYVDDISDAEYEAMDPEFNEDINAGVGSLINQVEQDLGIKPKEIEKEVEVKEEITGDQAAQEALNNKVKELEKEKADLRGKDGAVSEENMPRFLELLKEISKAKGLAQRGDTSIEGITISIKTRPKTATEDPTIILGDDANLAERVIEKIISKGIADGLSTEEIIQKINARYTFSANDLIYLSNYISDRNSEAPEVGNNKQSFPSWRKGVFDKTQVNDTAEKKETTKAEWVFQEHKDSTNGKGFTRVSETDKGVFEVIFAKTRESLLEGLKIAVDGYMASKDKQGNDLRNIYMIMKAHPYLSAEISKEIQDDFPFVYENALELFKQFATQVKPEQNITPPNSDDSSMPPPPPPPSAEDMEEATSSTGEWYDEAEWVEDKGPQGAMFDFLEDNTDISAQIQEVLDAKKRSLRARKMAALRESADRSKKRWSLAIANNDAIADGSKVYTDSGLEGKVAMILDTPESGTNVLIEDAKGDIHMVSIESVAKVNRNSDKLNKTTEENFLEFSEKKRKTSVGAHTSTSVPLIGRDKPAPMINPKTGAIETVDRAFLAYAHSPRDKSNDVITPFISISYLEKRIKSKLSSKVVAASQAKEPITINPRGIQIEGDIVTFKVKGMDSGKEDTVSIDFSSEEEHLRAEVETLGIFNKYKRGEKLTVDELAKFADYIPITLIVEGEGGSHAGTYIPGKTAANVESSFKSMEGAVRRSLVQKWLEAGGNLKKGRHPNQLEGVTLRWSHVGQGQLNIDPNAVEKGFNKVTNLQGVTYENMQLFAVQEDEGTMAAYDKDGVLRKDLTWATKDKKGMVILEIPTNTGGTFPLVLEQKKLGGTVELDIIMGAITQVVTTEGVNMKSKPSQKFLDRIKEKAPLLYDALDLNEVNYGNLIYSLVFPGRADSQTSLTVNDGSVTVGRYTYSAENFNEHKDSIKKRLGFKYFRTGFTNPSKDKGILTMSDNPAYTKYLIEGKILRTNAMENDDLFVSVAKQGSKHREGMGLFLTGSSVRGEKAPPKGGKEIKDSDRKVVITAGVRAKLHAQGVNIKALSNQRIEQLNELFHKTKFRGAGRGEFLEIVNQVNKEAGDREIKPCN